MAKEKAEAPQTPPSSNEGAETQSYVNMNERTQGQTNKNTLSERTCFTRKGIWTQAEKCLIIVGQENDSSFSDTNMYIIEMIYVHTHADSRTENETEGSS